MPETKYKADINYDSKMPHATLLCIQGETYLLENQSVGKELLVKAKFKVPR